MGVLSSVRRSMEYCTKQVGDLGSCGCPLSLSTPHRKGESVLVTVSLGNQNIHVNPDPLGE